MPEPTVQTRSAAGYPSRRRLGFLMALAAGVCWGTTGPLSTALYAEGAALTAVGFWRVALAVLALSAWGLARRDLFRMDRPGLLVVGLLGGACVAGFEVAYQFAIAGVGVAGAAALLYTAPVLVAVAARLLLGEALTPLRLLLAVGVMVGATLTVRGGSGVESLFASREQGMLLGVIGGLVAAVSYAGTTLIGRWAVPRYGPMRVLWFEIAGGTLLLGALLPMFGEAPALPSSAGAWVYIAALSGATVILANVLFFGALRRVEAAPVSVAATIEPVAGAALALVLLGQGLTGLGWIGLALVVASVAVGYLAEGAGGQAGRRAPGDPRP